MCQKIKLNCKFIQKIHLFITPSPRSHSNSNSPSLLLAQGVFRTCWSLMLAPDCPGYQLSCLQNFTKFLPVLISRILIRQQHDRRVGSAHWVSRGVTSDLLVFNLRRMQSKLRLFGSQLRSKTFKIVKNLLPGLSRKKLFSWLYLKRVEWRPPDLPQCSGQTSCSLVEAELRKRKSLDVPSSDYWYHVKEFKTITLFSSFLRLAEGESREALVTNGEKSDV